MLVRTHRRLHANPVTGILTKIVVTILGTAVTVAGLIMVVTPGPAVVVVPLGLAILALEYHWARRLLGWAKHKFEQGQARAAAIDPAVRRRRRIVAAVSVLLLAAGVAGYVYAYGWPGFAVTGWDWLQGLSPWLPELPGM